MLALLLAVAWARVDDVGKFQCPRPAKEYSAEQAGHTPRAAFRGPGGALVVICGGGKDSARWIDAAHLHAEADYTISLVQGGRTQMLESESEVMWRPADLTASEDALTIVRSLQSPYSDRPYTKTRIACTGSRCNVSGPQCVLRLRPTDDRGVVAKFDRALKARKGGPVDESEPFQLLDGLFLLAATGDRAAKQRLRHFPLPVDAAPGEILYTFQLYLAEAEKLGCGSTRTKE